MPGGNKPKPRPRPRPRPGKASWITDDEWIEDPVMPSTMTVHEDDGFTGLYDAQGNPLYRQKAPMGFVV